MAANQTILDGEAIDAVIPWVDGGDPIHKAKRDAALKREKQWSLMGVPAGHASTRFADAGELKYCIACIRKFIPWIRHIHLVTDAQRPTFLDATSCRSLRINIVDHTEIFRGYEWALPTFNSRTIETMIHRIPRLAERFIYFNDDIFILESTPPDAFFPDGKVAVRGEWLPLKQFGPFRQVISGIANHTFARVFSINRPMHILPQMRAAKMANVSGRFLKNYHVPIAVRRSTLFRYFDENPSHLEKNIRYRFRDMRQFNTMPLAIHLEIKSKNYSVITNREHETISFGARDRSLVKESMGRLLCARPYFLCIQSLDLASEREIETLFKYLDEAVEADRMNNCTSAT